MKKFISVLLAVCLTYVFLISGFAGLKNDAKLKFNGDGKFKIFVLADVQDDYPIEKAEIAFIEAALDKEQPDVVVFDGDNIVTSDVRAYEQLLAPLVKRNIPFTFVFGNHDDESSVLNKEEMLAEYQKYAGCLAYDADPSLHGCATHNLPVLSSDGSRVAFNLWLMDSGDYVFDANGNGLGYDWVRADQIKWYQNTRDSLKAENGGELVPSMMFQHIIPKEACEKIFYKSYIPLGDITMNFNDGTYLTFLPDITSFSGLLFERSCPGCGSDGQWQAIVEGGDVLGVVVGHDHVNGFVADVDGVDLIQTAGATYNSYSNSFLQGGRIIEVDENKPFEYTTYNVTTAELVSEGHTEISDADPEKTEAAYRFDFIFGKILDVFMNVLRYVLGDMFSITK